MRVKFWVEMLNSSNGTKSFVSFDETIISEFNLDINENWFDKFEPNKIDVKVVNGQLSDGQSRFEFILDNNGDVKVKDRQTGLFFVNNGKCYFEMSYDNVNFKRFFTGTVDGLPKLSIDDITLTFNCYDYMKLLENTKTTVNVYVNKTFSYIIEDMLKQVQNRLVGYGTNGGNITYTILIGSENPTIEYFVVEEDSKLLDVIKDLAKSVGGKFYFDENGNVVFNCGAYAQLETTATGIYLTQRNIVSMNINQTKNYDLIEINFKEYKPEKEMVEIFNPTKDDKTITVPPEGLPKDGDDYYVDFSGYYVSKIQPYNQVYFSASWNVQFDRDTYNSNINSDGYLKTPQKLKLKFNNTTKNLLTKQDGYIYGLLIKGNIFTLAESTYLYPELDPMNIDDKNKLSIDSKTICNKNMASKVGKFLYEFKNTTIDCEVGDYSLIFNNNFKIGKIITVDFPKFGLSNRNFVINRIRFDGQSVNLTLRLPYYTYIQGVPEPKGSVITNYIELPKTDLSIYYNKTLYFTNLQKYTYFVKNLLGVNGDFEYDSDNDGLADGWTDLNNNWSFSIVDGRQRITSRTTGTTWSQACDRQVTATQNGKIFIKATAQRTKTDFGDNALIFLWASGSGAFTIGFDNTTNLQTKYNSFTLTNTTMFYVILLPFGYFESQTLTFTAYTDFDNIIAVDLTQMGDLPSALKQFFTPSNIQKWEDLATTNQITAIDGTVKTGNDWLNDLIPFVKSEYEVPVFWYPE